MSACTNEDADPRVVEYLLQHGARVNLQRRARTIKWKMIHHAAKIYARTSKASSGLFRWIARLSDASALHHAASRGDLEIVQILLRHGADPSLKNGLGEDTVTICRSFPELRGMLEKRERILKLRDTGKKTGAGEVLGKRISTATPIQHEMWLISLENLLLLYVVFEREARDCHF